ncbi:cytoplasmic tRNA 2-thiolation protein 1 [Pezoporus wallicus]|uniref:cytoplasmic tRNA 2-thiolation protein 1 n=1 Tax=Pezoporus wallicus TaxID=35540 RepID=UPI00254F7D33|nr:cytoplasmic tRNA 2-thiolation protein 1 [Pezoporus wallicus]
MPLRSAVHAGKAPAARAEAPRLRRTGPLPAMPPPRCQLCPLPAALLRPRCGTPLCRDCFVLRFEAEFLGSITPVPGSRVPVPAPGSTVAVAASGGKDSTVLSHLLQRFGLRLGLRLALVSVDEGIAGYREAALAAVREGRGGAPLLVLSHRDVFGWSVDELGAALGAGSRCTFCGVLRRQALERAARLLGADWIATGHNADDIAETLLMNFLRGDVARLRRTASEGAVPRCKPLRHACEKEIVLYAHFRRLRYVSTECAYAARAFRGHARALLKGLEAARAAAVPALGHSGRRLPVAGDARAPRRPLCACARCGFASSQGLCKACVLQGALQSGRPRVALGKRAMEEVMGRAWGPGDGAGGGCGCGAGGRKGYGDGGHRGDGYGDHKGYGDGGCGDGGRRGDGYGGHKGYGDGGYGDGIHRGNEHKDGGCSCRAGGHKVDGYAAGDHKGDGYGAK